MRDRGETAVQIVYPTVDIAVEDGDGRVLAWCREYGLVEAEDEDP